MKWSIRSQITAIFIGLIVLILAGMFVINSGFLGQYYVAHKEKDLVDTYEVINRALSDGKFTSESVKDKVLNQSEKTNIDISIMDTAGGNIIFSTIKDERGLLFGRMLGYFFDKNQGDGIVLESTDAYQILKATDTANKTDYLEMWGYFSDGSFFTMRSPLESIRESASLANKFLVYMGITGIVLGGILVWFFSKKITKPVLELAELSRRMANLDFNAKYTSGGSNEIGVLGESFNIMSKRLEKTVLELKSANNKLLKDIEQKEKIEDMRNEFLGNVSHELKTPIALIQGYAEGLKEGVNDDPESREFYCDVIMDEAGKMNQMVKNLLTLNQLEFGSDELEFERFDIVGLIRGVIASCDILIQQAEASVSFVADLAVYVWADEFKTEQVVRNYLTNAIHHVENEKRIEIRVLPKQDTVRITVFNSGKPIPKEDVSKLWDKFYKVDKAHTREYGGNGIGLSIVKAIMESFHQAYGVQNFDNGVEFWFELEPDVSIKSEDCVKNEHYGQEKKEGAVEGQALHGKGNEVKYEELQ